MSSLHPFAFQFLKGAQSLRHITKPMVPSRDLIVVLEAMCEPLFEPLVSLELRMLTYKTTQALLSATHVRDLHVLWVHPSCIQFALDRSKVVLCTNSAYTPKASSLSCLACQMCLFTQRKTAEFMLCVLSEFCTDILSRHRLCSLPTSFCMLC